MRLALAQRAASADKQENLAGERRALAGCVEMLPATQRELVQMRYESGVSLRELAERAGRTVAAVNMMLVRVRRALLDCTQRALANSSGLANEA